ncbi:unnamed protein product [Protopolystoma xenopodis]|uniref:Integrin alpha-2 domain-containing protein n=1 Tax=Protopolystoma xenopodis TaxID=117903 RepID=A0A3S5APN0_9PLAT|nr:unnamed protein product [Protopolystoma xenopodis]
MLFLSPVQSRQVRSVDLTETEAKEAEEAERISSAHSIGSSATTPTSSFFRRSWAHTRFDCAAGNLSSPGSARAATLRQLAQTDEPSRPISAAGRGSSGAVTCARIVCSLDRLPRGDAVRVRWSGWLMASSVFRLRASDVHLTSRLSLADWGDRPTGLVPTHLWPEETPPPPLPPSFALEQYFLFRGVKALVPVHIPVWPIVVGLVVGLLVLVCLVLLLYQCGFFRRRRPTEQQQEQLVPENAAQMADQETKVGDSLHPLPSGNAHSDSLSNLDLAFLQPLGKLTIQQSAATPSSSLSSPSSRAVGGAVSEAPRRLRPSPELLVKESPNLICAQNPEPPSPRDVDVDWLGIFADCSVFSGDLDSSRLEDKAASPPSRIPTPPK